MRSKKTIYILLVLVLIILVAVMPKMTAKNQKTEKYGFLMDTQVRIIIYDKGDYSGIANECYGLIADIDNIMNTYNSQSELSRLNKKGSGVVSPELYHVVEKAVEFSEKTYGSFDVSVKPLSELWNFKNATVPNEEKIKNALKKVSYKNISLEDDFRINLKCDAQLDLGGIAKGFATDKAIEFLEKSGVSNALVDIGGNIKFIGSADKKKDGFYVGIQDPEENSGISLGALMLKNKSLVTGGIYERNFSSEGKLYNHILNPETGYPIDNELLSVSVICENSCDADAYATALMILGQDKGIELVNRTEGIECIMVKKDYEIILSSGIKKEEFEIKNDKYFIKE